MSNKELKYVYRFVFEEGEKAFPITVDGEKMEIVLPEGSQKPEWAKLELNKCKSCPLDESEHSHCPLALAIASSIQAFKNNASTELVKVKITTDDRVYFKSCDLQHGFSSMLGLLMPISGCPHFDFFKPMARFHLPFSTLEDTLYRVVSSFLLSKYFVDRGNPTHDLTELTGIYEGLQQVNSDFCQRLREAVNRDSGLNAVVILDTFAQLLPFSLQDGLEDLSYLYRNEKSNS